MAATVPRGDGRNQRLGGESVSRKRKVTSRGRTTLVRMLEHIHYEMHMFTCGLLVETMAVKFQDVVTASPEMHTNFLTNASIELRALHARNLAEFALSHRSGRNSIVARDFLPRFSPEKKDKAALKVIWARASREIAHITTERVTDVEQGNGADKSWPPPVFLPLLRALGSFTEGLLATWLESDSPYRPRYEVSGANFAELLRAWEEMTQETNA
jgi:hypothetical protein